MGSTMRLNIASKVLNFKYSLKSQRRSLKFFSTYKANHFSEKPTEYFINESEESKTKIFEINKSDDIYLLKMTNFDNRLTVETIPLLIKGLKDVETDFEKSFDFKDGFKGSSLILTGKDKFFSNGFDLSSVTKNNITYDDFFLNYFNPLALLFLNFKLPTVAAINGHAYAAGLMMALCLDFRIMREDRGFLCMPEVDLGISLSPGMTSIVQSGFTSKKSCNEFVLRGQRIDASQALQLELIHSKAPEEQVLVEAYKLAKSLAEKVGKNKFVYRNLRMQLKDETVKSLQTGGLGVLKGLKL